MAAASLWICTGLIGAKEATTVRNETDCVRWISRALPAILTDWNLEAWESRASTELRNSVRKAQVDKDFKLYRRVLGGLVRMEKPVGRVETDDRGGVQETIGYYTTYARFEHGSSNIAMRLVKRSGGWKFQQFKVRSELIPSRD